MKILCRKTLSGHLCPINDAGKEAVGRLAPQEVVSVEFRRPRNVMWHRRYWAALQLIFDNQTRYKTVDHLHAAVKIMLGHSDLITLKDGREVYVPRSESFSKMTQDEFEHYWQSFTALVVTQILPGVTKAELERELQELVA